MRWESHRAAKQSGFSYYNTTVLAGGAAIELLITKLPRYHRPEGMNNKKWTNSRTDTSHDPASQQKTRRFKNIKATSVKSDEDISVNLFPPTS